MQDKTDIGSGVVYDFDEMRRVCHQLRAIQFGIEGLAPERGQFSDGSSAYQGLTFMLYDIIEWLAPYNAVTEDKRLEQIQLQRQISAATMPKLKAT